MMDGRLKTAASEIHGEVSLAWRAQCGHHESPPANQGIGLIDMVVVNPLPV